MPHKTADQDFGLLQAIDERLAMYGWLTNTGVKIVAVVDMEGRPATSSDPKISAAVGIRDADLKPVRFPIFGLRSSKQTVFTPLLLSQGLVFDTASRPSAPCKTHTSTFYGIRSTSLMITPLLGRARRKRLVLRKSPA